MRKRLCLSLIIHLHRLRENFRKTYYSLTHTLNNQSYLCKLVKCDLEEQKEPPILYSPFQTSWAVWNQAKAVTKNRTINANADNRSDEEEEHRNDLNSLPHHWMIHTSNYMQLAGQEVRVESTSSILGVVWVEWPHFLSQFFGQPHRAHHRQLPAHPVPELELQSAPLRRKAEKVTQF